MRVINYALVPVLAAALVSCGGDGLGGPSGTLEAKGALAFAGSLNNTLPAMPDNSGRPSLGSIGGLPNGSVSTSSLGAKALGCETVTGNATDADSDGIAVLRTVTYNCTDFVQTTDTYSIYGTVTSIDKKDNGGASSKGLAGGYSVNIDLQSKHRNSTGTSLDYTTKGTFDATSSGNSSTFVSQYKTHFTGTQEAYGQVFEINYKYQTDFNVVYTAVTASTGTVKIDGLIGIDGQFPEAGKLEVAKAVMTVRSNNLTYNSACTTFFDQGDVEYVTGSGNVLALRYNCNATVKFYLDGQLLN
ncbi:MAG: hypothetical protein KF681_17150 [Bdellovibrionaceae bacterium]|nr:hypothetical protein [Pseudobdellovibrionaceae bacterium]